MDAGFDHPGLQNSAFGRDKDLTTVALIHPNHPY
jgi:hypothetical protein